MFELHLMWNYTYDEKDTEVQHIFDVYVTGKLCNQAFRKMPKNSRHFAKCLEFVLLYYTTCLVHFIACLVHFKAILIVPVRNLNYFIMADI